MTGKEFEELLERRLGLVKKVLHVKAKEYRRNDNPLHNFELGAKVTGVKETRVLDGMFLKHYLSYRDMLDDIDKGNYPTEEYIDEKLGDMINYMILQEAQIKNLINKSK